MGGARACRGRASVEEDGVGVPVGDLSHVLQDVLLGDDAQQPPVHMEGDRRQTREGRLSDTLWRDSSRFGGFFRSEITSGGASAPLLSPARALQPGGRRGASEGQSSDLLCSANSANNLVGWVKHQKQKFVKTIKG